MRARRYIFFGFLGCFVLASPAAHAFISLNVAQVGDHVVVTGSGSANITALTADSTDTEYTNVFTDSQIYAGPAVFADGQVSLWTGLSGPSVFGSKSGAIENPDIATSSGQFFGIMAKSGAGTSMLVLPLGYVSGASLSGTSTFTDRTLAQLGLTPGQVSLWTWGSGSAADSLRLEVLQPVPAPLPILMTGAVFAGLSRLRRLSKRLHS